MLEGVLTGLVRYAMRIMPDPVSEQHYLYRMSLSLYYGTAVNLHEQNIKCLRSHFPNTNCNRENLVCSLSPMGKLFNVKGHSSQKTCVTKGVEQRFTAAWKHFKTWITLATNNKHTTNKYTDVTFKNMNFSYKINWPLLYMLHIKSTIWWIPEYDEPTWPS